MEGGILGQQGSRKPSPVGGQSVPQEHLEGQPADQEWGMKPRGCGVGGVGAT